MNEVRRRCYIHVGLPKTGTSFLQSILFESRQALAQQDLSMLPAHSGGAFSLHLDMRGQLRRGIDPPRSFTAMDRLPRQAARVSTSRALITQELFSGADPDAIARLVGQLPGWEIHVVVTLRDLGRQLPSGWQQRIKARNVDSYEEFLIAARDRTPLAKPFWGHHDPLDVLARWQTAVPAERIHLVTVPQPGSPPALLLERFCSVFGIDPTTLSMSSVRENTSLGLVQAELLRRVNVALGDRLPHPRAGYRRVGKHYLARQILSPQGGTPPLLPATFATWTRDLSQEWVNALKSGGYDVVGDLDDLIPAPGCFSDQEQVVSDADVADSAVRALASMIDLRLAEQREVDTMRAQIRAHSAEPPGPRPGSSESGVGTRTRARLSRFVRRRR